MKLSLFVISATTAAKVEPITFNPSILIVLIKVSHRATRSTADLFKQQLAELGVDDERSQFSWAGEHIDGWDVHVIAMTVVNMAADAMAMKTATSLDEWNSLLRQAFNNLGANGFSKMFQYGCWSQYRPDIPGQLFYLQAYFIN